MSPKRLHLLIVEDEAAHVEAIRRAYEDAGAENEIEIQSVGTLREFRASVQVRQPDLVLMDLNLPDGCAVEVLTHPPENAPFPILVMTAFGNQQIVVAVMKAGALDYVVKSPASFATMPRTVEHTLREWELLQQHKRAETALCVSEEQFRTMFEMAPVGMAQADPRTGQWLRVNQRMCAITGYSAAEMLQMRIEELTHPADRQQDEEALRRIVRGEAPDYRIEKRYVRKDGTVAWVNVNMTIIRDADGQPLRTMATIEDITGRIQAAAAREKLEEQLRQSQKMESVGRLAGGVAHDFNNMLGVILGYAELAQAKLDPADPMRTCIQEIIDAGQRSANLTRQLLAFARKQVIAPRVLDVNDTVANMLTMLQRLIGENLELTWKPTANLWPVKIDPAQIDQLLANLVVNARDAIADVGTITIETEKVEINAAYCTGHADCIPGQYAMLAVSDDGCGMDQEVMAHLFEPFFTTKETGKGPGLGLAMVFGIVKQNGGFINVYSESGKGTTFKIYLPRHESAETAIATAPNLAETPTGTETVLLAEDEPALLELAQLLLAKLGYAVLVANSPTEAIRLADEYQGHIHLLMTDVVMPEMSGRDLLKQLNLRRPEIKCLFMSGYTADIIAHQGVLDQDIHFLQKPFSMTTLAVKLREALEGKAGT